MKKYISFCIIAVQVFISCDGDPAPNPEPGPGAEVPGQAQLSLPANNKECEQGEVSGNSATVNFEWNASTNTETYDLKITNLDNNASINKNNINGTSTSINLERGHPYSWMISSKNSGTTTIANSEVWKFYLAGDGESNFAPFPAEAISPETGATVNPTNGKITLNWENVQDPDGDTVSYTLYADATDGLQTPPAEWQDISGTSMEIAVDPGTVYYWRVITSDGTNSATSSIYSFKTAH